MTDYKNYLQTEGDVNLTENRQKWNAQLTDPATRAALKADSDHFLHQALSTPCLDVLESAEGIRIKTISGNSYIDFHGNNVHQLGYQNKFIIDRVKAQLDVLSFSPRRYTNQPAIDLAKRLSSLTNNELARVLFAPGGTSAIAMAMKLARIYTGKHKTIAMYDSFHGASMDSISLGGEQVFKQGLGPLLAGSIHIPPIDTYKGMWLREEGADKSDLAYAEYLEYVIEKEGDVGILVAETIRSTTVHVPSKAYWKRVREICDKHGVLLVLDEIPIGMGRTGAMFAYQHYGIVPDILVLGKGLGAGIIPIAAIVCKEELNVAAQISLGHFTHEKSPLGAAAALAVIDYMENNGTLKHVGEMAVAMETRLLQLKERCQFIGDVRGLGLLWGVELVVDRLTKEKNNLLADKVLYKCLELGLSLKVSDGNVLCLYPPLIISKEELKQALDILEEALISASETA
ncbi:MAG: aspartate aminotransferase family protein [Flavobacteriales bacterium]|nr:MAG: aspartate aminotransferase family protein [Flavobacteriales bacterium]